MPLKSMPLDFHIGKSAPNSHLTPLFITDFFLEKVSYEQGRAVFARKCAICGGKMKKNGQNFQLSMVIALHS